MWPFDAVWEDQGASPPACRHYPTAPPRASPGVHTQGVDSVDPWPRKPLALQEQQWDHPSGFEHDLRHRWQGECPPATFVCRRCSKQLPLTPTAVQPRCEPAQPFQPPVRPDCPAHLQHVRTQEDHPVLAIRLRSRCAGMRPTCPPTPTPLDRTAASTTSASVTTRGCVGT